MTIEGPPNPQNAPGGKQIAVGVDFDGVLVKKPPAFDIPRRASKMGLPAVDGARIGLGILNSSHGVEVMGVYTVRPEWLRSGQTVKQVQKHEFPVHKIVHTSNSPLEKIKTLLDDADAAVYYSTGERVPLSRRAQIVLIDDSVDKVVEAAKKLKETSPAHENALSRFTLLAFDPEQRHSVQGKIVPGTVHVVSMRGWDDLFSALKVVRGRVISHYNPLFKSPAK